MLKKKPITCRACGSTLESTGTGYRYTSISGDYPSMSRYQGKVFPSWHALRDLAWRHPKRKQRAEREAARWERRVIEMSGERQEAPKKLLAGLQSTGDDTPVGSPPTVDELVASAPMCSTTAQEAPDIQPRSMGDFVGQPGVKDKLSAAIAAANLRGTRLGHVLLRGPDGCGKRTLATVIANEIGAKMTSTDGTAIRRGGNLAAILTNLGSSDILCISNIHRLSRGVEEQLRGAMEDMSLDVEIGRGSSAKTIHLPLPPFTVVGIAGENDPVSQSVLQSFEYVLDFEPYEVWALVKLVRRLAQEASMDLDENAPLFIARDSDGSLRQARRLLLRARDYAQARAHSAVTAADVRDAVASMLDDRPSPASKAPEAESPKTALAPDGMSWQEFEDFVAQVFSALGYRNVRLTARAGDQGKDIVMERPDPLEGAKKVYVECKHWQSNRVGQRDVQILHSAVMKDPEVQEGLLVTTGTFTPQALEYARQIGFVELVDRKKLTELTAQAGMRQPHHSSLKENRHSGDDEHLETSPVQKATGACGLPAPSAPPAATEGQPPQVTKDVEALLAALDNLSVWARRMAGRLDEVHENEPMPSLPHRRPELTTKQYRARYNQAALRSLQSFRQLLDQAQQCLAGLQRTVDQWGLTRRTETRRLARQQQQLARHSSRYQQLVEKAFETYLSLRDTNPHPTLADCHREALEGMYYGLISAVGPFLKYPTKLYEGKTLYVTTEAPIAFVRLQRHRYLELTQRAWHGLVSLSRGTDPSERHGERSAPRAEGSSTFDS